MCVCVYIYIYIYIYIIILFPAPPFGASVPVCQCARVPVCMVSFQHFKFVFAAQTLAI